MGLKTIALAAVLAVVGSSAFANETIHTFESPQEMTIAMITNLDGKSGKYPLMELTEYCDLNDISEDKCSPDTVIHVGDTVSLKL